MAKQAGFATIVSHVRRNRRHLLADLAVATGAGQIKTALQSSERMAKYNQLLRIAEQLGAGGLLPRSVRFLSAPLMGKDIWPAQQGVPRY